MGGVASAGGGGGAAGGGGGGSAAVAGEVGMGPLEAAPAEVGAVDVTGGEVVDLLPLVLADVTDPEAAVGVEREAPRVAYAHDHDLGVLARREPDDLAEERLGVLGMVLRVVARAAVAEA